MATGALQLVSQHAAFHLRGCADAGNHAGAAFAGVDLLRPCQQGRQLFRRRNCRLDGCSLLGLWLERGHLQDAHGHPAPDRIVLCSTSMTCAMLYMGCISQVGAVMRL